MDQKNLLLVSEYDTIGPKLVFKRQIFFGTFCNKINIIIIHCREDCGLL